MRFPTLIGLALMCALLTDPQIASAQDQSQQRLAAGLQRAVEESGLIGAAGGLRVNDRVLALAAAGHRSKQRKVEVTVDDLWHLGSITKSMTALLIGSMLERGEIGLDDTVGELLPQRAPSMHRDWHGVTVHQLLTHTSGAAANFGPFVAFVEDPDLALDARRAALDSILQQAPRNTPGSTFVYSNLGYTLAGHLAETRLAIPYHQALRLRVFDPLKLASAGFGPPPGDQPVGHANLLGFKSMAPRSGRGSDNTFIIAPAGLVHSSISDLLRYGQAHLDGALGRDGLLPAAVMARLHQPVLDGYAAGLVVMEREYAGGRMLWHNGSNTQWYALLVIAPEKNAVVGLATNDGAVKKAEAAFFELAAQLLEGIE